MEERMVILWQKSPENTFPWEWWRQYLRVSILLSAIAKKPIAIASLATPSPPLSDSSPPLKSPGASTRDILILIPFSSKQKPAVILTKDNENRWQVWDWVAWRAWSC